MDTKFDELFECEYFEGEVVGDEWIDAHCTVLRVKKPDAIPEHLVIPSYIEDGYDTIYITEIAAGACAGLHQVRSVEIGGNVSDIGDRAFADCENLREVTFGRDINHFIGIGGEHGDGDIYIGSDAFQGCNAISEVRFCNVESLCKMHFCNRFSNPAHFTKNVLFGGVRVGDCLEIPAKIQRSYSHAYLRSYAFCGLDITTLKIAEGVKELEIQPHAFDGCENLTDFIRPEDLKFFDPSGLVDCKNLKCNEYEGLKYLGNGQNPYWALVGVAKEQPSYACHPETRLLCDGAFENAAFCEFTFSDGVTKIPKNAFKNCVKLKSVQFPPKITYICDDAFAGCRSLLRADLPDEMSAVCARAFYGCTALQSVTLPTHIEWCVHESAFENCVSLKAVTVPRSYILHKRAFAGCTALQSVILGAGGIGEEAFEGCSSLTEIKMYDWMDKIEKGAFCGCTALEKVKLPKGVKWIEDGAFENCTALKTINLPDQIKNLGKNVFQGCSETLEIIASEKIKKMIN